MALAERVEKLEKRVRIIEDWKSKVEVAILAGSIFLAGVVVGRTPDE